MEFPLNQEESTKYQHQSMVHGNPQNYQNYSYLNQNRYQNEQQQCAKNYEPAQSHGFQGNAQNIKIEGSDTTAKVKLESPSHSEINTFSGDKSETNLPSDFQSHPAYSYPIQNGADHSEQEKWTNNHEQEQSQVIAEGAVIYRAIECPHCFEHCALLRQIVLFLAEIANP